MPEGTFASRAVVTPTPLLKTKEIRHSDGYRSRYIIINQELDSFLNTPRCMQRSSHPLISPDLSCSSQHARKGELYGPFS